jgi:phage terminase large subunit
LALSDDGEPETALPRYASALWEPARHYSLYGGRGGGKSWAIADHLLIRAAQEVMRVGCAREIQKDIKDSVKQLLDDRIDALGLRSFYTSTYSPPYEIRGKNGSKFTFFGLWRNPDGIKSTEGMDRVWIEEAARVSQRSIDLLLPTVRKEGSALIWSWNPEYDHDPVERLFRGPTGPPPRTILREVSHRDNPWFPAALREQMEHMYASQPDKAAHVYGGQYVQAVEGAYFARELRTARDEGRFCYLARDPNFEIRAYWDLGHNDATAIWVAQFAGDRVLVLDYCEGSGQPPGYYMQWLRSSGYEQALCVLPHDGSSVHPDNPISMSYEDQMRRAGFRVQVIRNQGRGAAQQRIDALRRLFPRLWFNDDPTRTGVKALAHYHERRDESRNVGLGPEHDWSSHASDAIGLLAITYEPPRRTLASGTYTLPDFGAV